MAKKKFRTPGPLKGGNKPPAPAPADPAAATDPADSPPVDPNAAGGAAPADGMGEESNDPVIAQVQDKVRQTLPPQFRVAVQKLVLAGQKIMYDPKTHHLMVQALQSDSDPAHAVGMGVTQLMTMMWVQSKGSIPLPAMIPASILLVCEALDFCEQSKLLKPDNDMIGNAVQVVVSYMMQKMNITPADMAKVGGQGNQAPPPNTQTPGAPVGQGQQPPQAPPPQTGGGGLIGAAMGAQNGGT